MTNSSFLPYPIVSSFLSCQILTCLIKESVSLFSMFCFSAPFGGGEVGFWELDHILYFENVLVTYFIYYFICEWNLHCAALTPEAVTKPMCVCGIFRLQMDWTLTSLVVKTFWKGSFCTLWSCSVKLFYLQIHGIASSLCLIFFNCGPSKVRENKAAAFYIDEQFSRRLFTVRRYQ